MTTYTGLDRPQFFATGNINPCVFVKQDTTGDFWILQATDGTSSAGDPILGISGESTEAAPITGASTYHASTTNPEAVVRLPGEVALLTLGSGGATAGDRLKADANGKGITVGAYSSSTGQNVGAIALRSGSAGEKIEVLVTREYF